MSDMFFLSLTSTYCRLAWKQSKEAYKVESNKLKGMVKY